MATAARAVRDGNAGEHQQKEFLNWLVFQACAKSYPAYHASERDTSFALGRHFVADQINGLLTVDIDLLRKSEK